MGFIILEQVHHVLVVELEEGTEHFDVLASLGDDGVEDEIDSARNEPSVVLVLL